jgi:tetratricopeptide (TPR) repeat protein
LGLCRKGGAAFAAFSLALALGVAAPAHADGVADGNAGRAALLAGNTDEAIRLFTRALSLGQLTRQNQAVTLNLRGRAYLNRGQIDVALEDLNDSLKLMDNADARYNRATIYLDQYRFDDCIDDLTRAMALGGQGADVYATRGQAYVYTGQLDLALKDLNDAIARQPTYGFAYRTRGHAYMNLNQDDKAIADETKAISLDPKDVEAYWLRAYAYRYRKHAMDKAIADYTRALAIQPSDIANRTSRAEAYEQTGRNDLAAADYDALIQFNPRGPFGYQARGRLNLILGRNAAAAADLARAIALKPTDPYTVLWLHLARERAGTDDQAELQANITKLDRAAWPAPVLSFIAGKITDDELLAAAAKGEGAAKPTRACEALIVLAQDDLFKGRKTEGLLRLERAQQICAPETPEAHLARADLIRNGVTPRAIMASTAPKSATTTPPARVKPALQSQAQAQTQTGATGPLGLRGSLK